MLKTLDKLLAACSDLAVATGGLLLLLIALIGAADMVLTAVINYPIPAASTFAEQVLPSSVALSTGYLLRRNANIVVDIVTNMVGGPARRILAVLAGLATALFFVGFTWGTWKLAIDSIALSEVAVAAIEFPVWPLKLLFAIGSTIAFLESLALVVRDILLPLPPSSIQLEGAVIEKVDP